MLRIQPPPGYSGDTEEKSKFEEAAWNKTEVTLRRKERKRDEGMRRRKRGYEGKNEDQQVVSKRLGVSKDNTWGTINRSTGP